jgi:hypothetical protein
VKDGLPVHLLVSAVLQVCDAEGARAYVFLFAVVLWPVACFCDSPDTRPFRFWAMFMVKTAAEVSCHVGDATRRYI